MDVLLPVFKRLPKPNVTVAISQFTLLIGFAVSGRSWDRAPITQPKKYLEVYGKYLKPLIAGRVAVGRSGQSRKYRQLFDTNIR